MGQRLLRLIINPNEIENNPAHLKVNSFTPMVSALRPILAWSKVASPGEAIFWTQMVFHTPLESSALPLLLSGLTSLIKPDENQLLWRSFRYCLTN